MIKSIMNINVTAMDTRRKLASRQEHNQNSKVQNHRLSPEDHSVTIKLEEHKESRNPIVTAV